MKVILPKPPLVEILRIPSAKPGDVVTVLDNNGESVGVFVVASNEAFTKFSNRFPGTDQPSAPAHASPPPPHPPLPEQGGPAWGGTYRLFNPTTGELFTTNGNLRIRIEHAAALVIDAL